MLPIDLGAGNKASCQFVMCQLLITFKHILGKRYCKAKATLLCQRHELLCPTSVSGECL